MNTATAVIINNSHLLRLKFVVCAMINIFYRITCGHPFADTQNVAVTAASTQKPAIYLVSADTELYH